MKATIQDREALLAVSPVALSAYARAEGWSKEEPYGEFSDVYVAKGLPEIILPRTENLADYASVVSTLIEIFARVAGVDELTLYRNLVTADRDVIRMRAADSDDGTVSMNEGVDFVRGASEIMLAAACSYHKPQPLFRAGAHKEAQAFLRQMRLGQTEQGSYVVTLLSPVVPPPMQLALDPRPEEFPDDSVERRITRHLAGSLKAARQAIEGTVGGASDAFAEVVDRGVSANLCEALDTMIIPFSKMDVSFVWARTRPLPKAREVIRFSNDDAPILREAARALRQRGPRHDESLVGFVNILNRTEDREEGKIRLKAEIEGQMQSVNAVLDQFEYARAIQAHAEKSTVIAEGDLERIGNRWNLRNARIKTIISNEEPPTDLPSKNWSR
ncbi:MAG: hypothetical protein OXI80_08360 [Caldilineaceae bacterium]|nr:hypothetical protein [Caldilineaceae bacterium]MDE0337670.1 hypothetical protein [Caldilineaceae bacterium]